MIIRILLFLTGLSLAIWLTYLLLLHISIRGILRSWRRTPSRVQQEFGFSHPEHFSLEYEEIAIEVDPGITLAGWLMRTRKPRRGILVYHHGVWDAGSPRLPLVERMTPHGFDCILYDSRGQGRSGGRYCTYGEREKHDLARILDLAETRGVDSSHVVVVGHSMGAATAVYAAGIDPRIRALVLEACYHDLPTAVHDYARLLAPVIPSFIVRKALIRAGTIGGFEPTTLSPFRLMPQLNVPVLFVQGTADRRIKPHYAQEHFDVKPHPKELHFIEGARHGRLWHEGGARYLDKLEQWLCAQMPVLNVQPTP